MVFKALSSSGQLLNPGWVVLLKVSTNVAMRMRTALDRRKPTLFMDSTTVSVSEAQRFLISSNMFKVKLCVSYQIYGCFIRPEFMSLLLALTLVVIVLYYSSLIILKY